MLVVEVDVVVVEPVEHPVAPQVDVVDTELWPPLLAAMPTATPIIPMPIAPIAQSGIEAISA